MLKKIIIILYFKFFYVIINKKIGGNMFDQGAWEDERDEAYDNWIALQKK